VLRQFLDGFFVDANWNLFIEEKAESNHIAFESIFIEFVVRISTPTEEFSSFAMCLPSAFHHPRDT
jgi:hypothetical protein